MPADRAPTFQPLYLQIKALLEQSLEARRVGARARRSRPRSSSPRRFGVSQGTVRKAIDALAADNLRRAPPGQGHVRRDAHRGAGVAASASCASAATTARRSTRRSRLLDVRRGQGGRRDRAPARPASRATRVLVLRRVLDYAGEPVVLDEITLPAALFRGLTTRALRRVPRLDVRLLRDGSSACAC